MCGKKRRRNLIFNNKKGLSHELFFNIFELTLAAMIALALFLFVSDVAEQTIFQKNFLVRDLALVVNTLYTAPGDVVFNYGEDTSKFTLEFTENKITVTRKGVEDNSNIFYLFAENKKIPFLYKTLTFDEEDKIGFFKSSQIIEVDNAGVLNYKITYSVEGVDTVGS